MLSCYFYHKILLTIIYIILCDVRQVLGEFVQECHKGAYLFSCMNQNELVNSTEIRCSHAKNHISIE